MTTSRTLHVRCPPPRPGRRSGCEGWVHRRRELAAVTFLVVRDRSGLAQVVLPGREPSCRPRRRPSR